MTVPTQQTVPAAVRELERLLVVRVGVGDARLFSAPQPVRSRAVELPLAEHLLDHRRELRHWLASLPPSGGRDWVSAPQRLLAGRFRAWLQERNQFLTFDEATTVALQGAYSEAGHDLLDSLHKGDRHDIEAVFERHHSRLRAVVEDRLGGDLRAAPGAQYSPATQLAVLGLAPLRPGVRVLDLGSGTDELLVQHFRAQGVDAHGIDRVHGDDWLTYDFGQRRWDLVVSHLGFSLHFLHHEQRGADAAYAYARAYMRILAGLRPGGVFAYAPALPLFEELLGADFMVQRLPWPTGRPPGVLARPDTPEALRAYRATQVTRLV